MKNTLMIVMIVMIVMTSFSCSNYTIINEYSNEALSKCSINIRLENKINEAELTDIALKLRNSRKEYKNISIFYYLPEMTVNKGAWAYTHFNPDIEVMILGADKEERDILDNATVENKEIVGRWRDYSPSMESMNIIFKDFDTLKIKMVFQDGSELVKSLSYKITDGIKYFNYSDTTIKEYFILEPNGDLSFYGLTGKFSEAKKIE